MSDGNHRITPSFRPAQTEKRPPCQCGCPNASDIRGWIALIAQRAKIGLSRAEAYTQAWRTITNVNPFPSVLGRICPHPCESRCNRGTFEEPLAINAMERFLGDWALGEGLPLPRLVDAAATESIGVVGAGPSGLSFAYQLVRRGYRVTVYEARPRPGGMLRYGIPDYRLAPDILEAEIQRILDLGVELRLDTRIGVHLTLDELRARHEAIYLGLGAQRGRGLDVPGETGPSVWSGADYLRRVNSGEAVDVGRRVVVVGGGNTAVDAARTARRAGADVTMVYRRSRAEMPAIAHEIEEALEEGVCLHLQAAPVRLDREDGILRRFIACRIELGAPDASGRRRPVVVPGSDFAIPADTVIAAVSQEPDTAGFEALLADDGRLVAGASGGVDAGVWAGGDVLASGIAAEAVVQGRRAAEALHAHFRGLPPPAPADVQAPIAPERLLADFYERRPAARPERRPPAARLRDPASEVTSRISEPQFLAEARRCLSCGSCFGCQQCAMYCTAHCFASLDRVWPGRYFSLSLDECQECGKCAAVCPCGYLEIASNGGGAPGH